MATKQAVVASVAALYTAAGRNFAEVEFSLYHNCLTGIEDDALTEAVAQIVKSVDLGQRPPSPALVLETVRGIARRNDLESQPLSIAAPVPTPTQQERIKAHIAAAREHIANAKTPRRSA